MTIGCMINRFLHPFGVEICRNLEKDISEGRYRWIQGLKISTVLDIGANVGQFARFIHAILPDADIYSFEPVKNSFNELSEQTRKLPSLKCFNVALGNEETTRPIHRSKFSPSSSLLPMKDLHKQAFPYTRGLEPETVTVTTLDTQLSGVELKRRVLAKIDVQGYEMHVLQGSTKTLPLVDILLIETSFVELYQAQPLFKDVYDFLTKRNFTYSGSFDQMTHPKNGAVLQSDSIFVKNDCQRFLV